ncbi:hypothetical protein Tco_1381537, partial [Tanacetum coccineum]
SGTNVQPLSQPKAPTAKKSKKKIIPSLTQLKVSKDSREMNPPSTTTHLQATKDYVVTAVPIQSLEASVTAEVQVNQLKPVDTTEFMQVPKKIVEKEEVAEEQTLEIPTVAQLLNEVNKAAQETPQSPYDTKSEIKSMPDVDLRSVSGFEAADSNDTNDNEVSHSAHTSHDIAFGERLSIPDHLDHIYEEVSHLQSRLGNMEFFTVQTLRDVKDLLETNTIPALNQGEQKTAENITPPEPSPEIQGELAYKESTIPVSKIKVNEESSMVLYNPGKDLFTDQLFGTTSSKYSPTPLREPTPPRDLSKGKAAAIIEEPSNELVQYQKEGGSNPKAPKLKPFITLEGPLSQKEFDRQIKELKRISGLKAEKEKLEQELRKLLNPATLKAQAQKWTEHEVKKAKMMEEYNHQISFRADVTFVI